MSNRYLLHPDGHDDNGGGYDLLGSAGYSDCHSSFGPVANRTGCSITNNGSGKVRIEDEGAFSSDMSGVIVNCTFSDGDSTYTCGRYVIIDASSTYIDIDVTYTSATPTVDVRVGGAIKSPDVAADLAYGTDDDELVLPANQATQTENLVDGSANQVLCSADGSTLNAYSVDEDTGVKLTTTDSTKWAVIKAKDSSTWSADTALLQFDSYASNYPTLKLDKIILDGNQLTPRVLGLGSSSSNHMYLDCGDLKVKNSHPSTGYGVYQYGYVDCDYFGGGINQLKIESCYRGFYTTIREALYIRDTIHIHNCTTGINMSYIYPYYFNTLNRCIISDCDVGIRITSKISSNIDVTFTFINNDLDIQIDYNYGTLNRLWIRNSLFEHSAGGGNILQFDSNGDKIELTLENCVYSDEATLTNAYSTPLLVDCQTIHGYPFKSTSDYSLDPDFSDLSKIWDWDKQTNCIGATTPAEPESGGGGGCSVNRIFGGL